MTNNPVTKPLILAHRGSSGLWIQNSRFAIQQSVERYNNQSLQLDGIEVDIVLTKDNIPVISHDPWIHTRLCEYTDNTKGELDKVFIKDILFKDLQRQFICGGKIDDDFPLAETKAESILGFEEFLVLMAKAPELIIYLDSKLQEPLTQSAEDYAKAIFSIWKKSGNKNPLYIEAPDKASLEKYQRYANTPFTAVLSSPPFYANHNPWLQGFKTLLHDFILPTSARKKVINANADGAAIPLTVLNSRTLYHLQKENKKVIVFTPNDQKTLQKACDMGVDIIITDFPNLQPCQ